MGEAFGGVILFIFIIWILISFISMPYFWFNRTDRSQTPIARRAVAIGYGLVWPIVVIVSLKNRRQEAVDSEKSKSLGDSILGNKDK